MGRMTNRVKSNRAGGRNTRRVSARSCATELCLRLAFVAPRAGMDAEVMEISVISIRFHGGRYAAPHIRGAAMETVRSAQFECVLNLLGALFGGHLAGNDLD
ncbi:hypothetical protein D3C78_1175290 [compost metagenome]